MILENSYRGILIGYILEFFITERLFESIESSELRKIIQEKLDLALKFTTRVSEINTKNNSSMQIYFEGESGEIRVLDYTIEYFPLDSTSF